MKRTLFLLVFVCCAVCTAAQSTFSIVHAAANTSAGSGRSVFETDNGYLVFSAQLDPEFDRTWLFATALDPNGDVIEVKQYRTRRSMDAGLVDCVAANPDGTFTAAVSHFSSTEPDSLYLYHFDATGDTLSTHFVLAEELGVRDCIRVDDGSFFIVGWCTLTEEPPDVCGCIRKVTPDGELQWTRLWPQFESFSTINRMEGGMHLVGGRRQVPQNVNATVLLKVDEEGEEQWCRFIGGYSSYTGGSGRSVLLANGNYLIPGSWLPADSADVNEHGYASLYTFSPVGIELSRNDLMYGRYAGAALVRRTPEDELVVVGGRYQYFINPDLAAFIWRTNAMGDTLYNRKYWFYDGNGAENVATYGMDLTSDGGAIFTGLARQGVEGEFPYRRYTWVLKLDSMGCLVPGCQNVGVQDHELALQQALRLTPNPASEHCMMMLALPNGYAVHGAVQARVLDAQGKEVLRQKVNSTPAELNATLNVAALPSGLYYLHVRDERKWLAGGKLVVE